MPYKIIPDISVKQQEIMDLVYKFRFINRKQIQEILGHKDARRINTWLKDLVEKKYLGRIYSHKLLENTKPAIYYLMDNGILWVQTNVGLDYNGEDLEVKHVKKFYEDKHASDTFRNHCLFLCEMYLQIKRHEKNTDWEYSFTTKTELLIERGHDEDFAETRKHIPNAFIDKLNQEGDDWATFMLELFDPQTPRYALQYKVKQYLKFRDEGDWSFYESKNEKFPKIIFILPTQQKLSRLANFIQEQLDRSYDVEDVEFMLTTYEKVKTNGITGSIWRIVKESPP